MMMNLSSKFFYKLWVANQMQSSTMQTDIFRQLTSEIRDDQ